MKIAVTGAACKTSTCVAADIEANRVVVFLWFVWVWFLLGREASGTCDGWWCVTKSFREEW